jgi:hypothetical protein
MYDTLQVSCPNCLADLHIQSKAGPCNLAQYDLKMCHPEVASSMHGESLTCEDCKHTFYLKLEVQPKLVIVDVDPGKLCDYCGEPSDKDTWCVNPNCPSGI